MRPSTARLFRRTLREARGLRPSPGTQPITKKLDTKYQSIDKPMKTGYQSWEKPITNAPAK
jgi:hypothetical protein